ncbi:oxidoreductase C-terminal domain-containing protein [Ramlibacter sp. 2FC]|uniref:oxidoreductase C-terminal domain-containing protein n=1 Tax=Ramlibacter sp. 2FC TaxID=2502188 RepID=UPI0010F6C283|nr:oxidoreductase C-terminal domain-containing protein [Ramlibacter sp. 2FC]
MESPCPTTIWSSRSARGHGGCQSRLRGDADERVVLGDPTAGNLSVLCISDGVLCAVESVNRPADHMLARRLLAKHTRVSPAQAREPGFALKML